jgi:hypothetical protein
VPYNPSYLAGWSAESYRIQLAQAWELGQTIVQRQEVDACGREGPATLTATCASTRTCRA